MDIFKNLRVTLICFLIIVLCYPRTPKYSLLVTGCLPTGNTYIYLFLSWCHSGLEDLTKRFRPNLVVRGNRCSAFGEDKWKSISIGSNHFKVRVALPAYRNPKEISSLYLSMSLNRDYMLCAATVSKVTSARYASGFRFHSPQFGFWSV